MTDTDETKRPKTLSLKKTETSTVKQSFSHGRTKAVVVENADHGTRLMESGEVTVMPYWNGRTARLQEAKIPAAFEIVPGTVLVGSGFSIIATRGTAATISAAGIPLAVVNKVTEGRPHIVDMIKNDEIALIINTVEEKRGAINDSRSIRTSGLQARVTMYTTIWGAEAAAEGIRHLGELVVYPIQTLHSQLH